MVGLLRAGAGSAAVVALLVLASSLGAQSRPATVIVVRHAERAAEPKEDPTLTAAGRERVSALLATVRDAGVSVIYSTDKRRNLETARPVGEAVNARVIELPIESGKIDDYVRDLVSRIRKDGGGRVSLVVGHSNTLGPLIEALGGPAIGEIADTRYDDVFVLTVRAGEKTRLVRGKYGRRSP